MNDNFDEEERFNLALNSDFDSALLNCLGDDDDRDNNDDLGGGDTSDFSQSPARTSTPVGAQMPRLPSFLLNDSGNNVVAGGSTSSLTGGDPLVAMDRSSPLEAANALATSAHALETSGDPQKFANNINNSNANASIAAAQMHPLAISSSARCPPVNNASIPGAGPGLNNNNNTMGLPTLADPNMTAALQAAFATSFMQLSSNPAFNPALIPLAYNALAAGVDLSNFLPQFQAPSTSSFPTAQPLTEGHAAPLQTSPASVPPVASITATTTTTSHSQDAKHSSTKKSAKSSKRKRSGHGSSNKRSKSSTNQSSPPFQIFDAPVELRQNFIQSQRAHGLPVLEDNNSYHFGMTVNGFHPQRSLEQPFLYKSLDAKRPLPNPVPVVDARHAEGGNKRLKNAKEQKRAHRISELIDQLRNKMEKGGWKVGIKSKFHTLSSCSDYVRHLIQLNQEKEAAVAKAKGDLEAKQVKMEEEKRTQQDPSDPESTTSTLTVSSSSEQTDKKKAASEYRTGQSATKNTRHLESHESTVSQSLSLGATSTVSDITDSNKGLSSKESCWDAASRKAAPVQESDVTTSSSSAVASTSDTNRSSQRRHKDVVALNKSESMPPIAPASIASEKTSIDTDFKLDYEEVFLKSNVPQILAATNGRIVSFNDFFLKVSGLTKKEVESLTIFSLVQTSLLSNLFEIVAAALRSSTDEEKAKHEEQDREGSTQESKLTPLKDYTAITLPCVDFASAFRKEGRAAVALSRSTRQLHMTVTLMTDNDMTKRCFHCAFTDCPGTKGALGTVTPELLSALFTRSQSDEVNQPFPESDSVKPELDQEEEGEMAITEDEDE